MPNLYEALIAMVRDHWKSHDNAYPQRIELNASDMQALLDERQLVNESMNFPLQPGWEHIFLGTPVQRGGCQLCGGCARPAFADHTAQQ